MTIATWPVVDWRRVVRAYKPGDPSAAEGPFRTLKKHNWASAGVRVTRRTGRRLDGQRMVFSSLNVDSARLARRGNGDAATRLASAAAVIESGLEFALLRSILADLPDREAQSVIDGVLPDDAPDNLSAALQAVARRTEECREAELDLSLAIEIVAGRVAEVHEGHVTIVGVGGVTTAIPRWMAIAARRDEVGVTLVLVLDKLDDGRALVEVTPAIDVDGLTGDPKPLRILVPVPIDA